MAANGSSESHGNNIETERGGPNGEAGFSLIETDDRHGDPGDGAARAWPASSRWGCAPGGSSANLIAREKAREAVESVHTARDTRTHRLVRRSKRRTATNLRMAPWRFLDGPSRLQGRASTASSTRPTTPGRSEVSVAPGPDGVLGNTDDVRNPLTNFTREIAITDVLPVPNGDASGRSRGHHHLHGRDSRQRTYTLTTFVSSIS